MGIPETVWLAIVGVVALLVKEYFDRLRYTHADEKIKGMVMKVDTAVEHVATVQTAVVDVKDKLKEVAVATNGLSKSLGAAQAETAFLEGEKAGKQQEQVRQANGIVQANQQTKPCQ